MALCFGIRTGSRISSRYLRKESKPHRPFESRLSAQLAAGVAFATLTEDVIEPDPGVLASLLRERLLLGAVLLATLCIVAVYRSPPAASTARLE